MTTAHEPLPPQIQLEGFLLAFQQSWMSEPTYTWHSAEMKAQGYVTICPHTISADVPVGFNFIAEQVKALQQKQKAKKQEAYEEVERIEQHIQSLLSLPAPASAPIAAGNFDDDIPF